MKSDAPKRIVMQFHARPSKNQMADAFNEGFCRQLARRHEDYEVRHRQVEWRARNLNSGDEMVFTYVPGTGTTLAINGKDKVTIAGQPFEQALLSVWLGPKPPTADLKNRNARQVADQRFAACSQRFGMRKMRLVSARRIYALQL